MQLKRVSSERPQAWPPWRAAGGRGSCARSLAQLLLCLYVLAAPLPAAAPPPSPPLRAVVTGVGGRNFSAAVHASTPGSVAYVAWLASDALTYGAPVSADVWAGNGPDGLPLDSSRAGTVTVVRHATALPRPARATQLMRAVPRLRVVSSRAAHRVGVCGRARWPGAAVADQLHALARGRPDKRHRRVLRVCMHATLAANALRRHPSLCRRGCADAGCHAAVLQCGNAACPGSRRVGRVASGVAQRAGCGVVPAANARRQPAERRRRAAQREARRVGRSLRAAPPPDAHATLSPSRLHAQRPSGASYCRHGSNGVHHSGRGPRRHICAVPCRRRRRDADAQREGAPAARVSSAL